METNHKLKLKCTLLTDVALNQKSATEGSQLTLDFIPGNNFLGIVAAQLYNKVDKQKALTLFHTGDVKFGDAHPSKDNVRGLKIPASLYYPKLQSKEEVCYVHHLIKDLSSDEMKSMQLKQCRSGFYVFENQQALEISTAKRFAIKSAYDKANRCSKDKMMYGYESLERGSEFYFEVCFNEQSVGLMEQVKESLVGERRIGRSRTAQYGLVKIEECAYSETCSKPEARFDDNLVTVYADGRLIFLDEYGIPTFRPTGDMLGIPKGTVCWEKSQIRIFQYAPWNFKRQTYDTDRCGIEKGSVFVVKVNEKIECTSDYVGAYQNEGFGKVIYNPDFLSGDENGVACYQFVEEEKPEDRINNKEKPKDAANNEKILDSQYPLVKFLIRQKKAEDTQRKVYEKVNKFVDQNLSCYKGGESFASQWGSIRTIASNPEVGDVKKAILKYLGHGVAKDKWDKKQRRQKLEEFMKPFEGDELRLAVVNLAAEMGKLL